MDQQKLMQEGFNVVLKWETLGNGTAVKTTDEAQFIALAHRYKPDAVFYQEGVPNSSGVAKRVFFVYLGMVYLYLGN